MDIKFNNLYILNFQLLLIHIMSLLAFNAAWLVIKGTEKVKNSQNEVIKGPIQFRYGRSNTSCKSTTQFKIIVRLHYDWRGHK